MITHIYVKVIPKPGWERYADQFTYKAPKGRFFLEENIDDVLLKVVSLLDRRFPEWEFRVVEVKHFSANTKQFNFMYDKMRAHGLETVQKETASSDNLTVGRNDGMVQAAGSPEHQERPGSTGTGGNGYDRKV